MAFFFNSIRGVIMEPRKQMGITGETVALEYLQKRGYRLVRRNFVCKAGEIDLIMHKDDMLVFVEVRSRKSNLYGEPSETVNRKKQDKIRKTAAYFLYTNPSFERYYCRFDVISIVWQEDTAAVEWLPDAFQ